MSLLGLGGGAGSVQSDESLLGLGGGAGSAHSECLLGLGVGVGPRPQLV